MIKEIDESHINAVRQEIELLSQDLGQIEDAMKEDFCNQQYYEGDLECWRNLKRRINRLEDELKAKDREPERNRYGEY